MSEEKLAKLKRQLDAESPEEEKSRELPPAMSSTKSSASSRSGQEETSHADAGVKVEPSESSSQPSSKQADVWSSISEDPADIGSDGKKKRRPQTMEESMRAFGIDVDAMNRLGERRKPTDINEFVAAAMQAANAQETARKRDLEVEEDLEEARREKELRDDEVHVDTEGEGAPEMHGRPMPDLGKILPDSVKGKLAGIFSKFGTSLDPEASSILSQLLPEEGSETGKAEGEEEDDGSTEDLAGLMASLNAGGGGLTDISAQLEELERERKERDEKMEKAAEERRAEMQRRQEQRDLEHKKFEEEMAAREEERKKQRAEFEEGRKKHA